MRLGFNSLIAAVLAFASIAAITLLAREEYFALTPYITFLSIGSAGVWCLLRPDNALRRWHVLIFALLLHSIAFFGNSMVEDDWYRFVWDGAQLAMNGTPYGTPPSRWYGQFDLPPDLQNILDAVNNPDVPTIYGPFLQGVFAIIWLLAGTDPIGLKLAFLAANLLLILLMLRKYAPWQVARYGWAPLPITELIIHLHPDGIMAMLVMAALIAGPARPWLAGALLAGAAGAKIVALALWPALLRLGWKGITAALITIAALYLPFFAQGQGAGFDGTKKFADVWLFNPLLFKLTGLFAYHPVARLGVALIGIAAIMILHGRTRSWADLPIAPIFAVIFFIAPAVNPWYLIWILPFAVGSRQIWPAAAMLALPLSYFTGLNLDNDSLYAYEIHPAAWWTEIAILIAALGYDITGLRGKRDSAAKERRDRSPIKNPKIAVVIPALNEELSVGKVVTNLRNLKYSMDIFVVDNGSTDATAAKAKAAEATLVTQGERGYGAACLAGIAALPGDTDILLFVDADGSDDISDAPNLLEPIIGGHADIVIGSRDLGQMERGAMTPPQRFGNWLATRLIWLFWGKRMTDLGPFRAVRRDVLNDMEMADRDFGWTVEMQVKAARRNLRLIEVPTDYFRRVGVSKISGTIDGVIKAGSKILYVIGREAFCR